MFVNEMKARAFILATCGVTAGRVVSNFENCVEFELPFGIDLPAAINRAEETLGVTHVSENPAVDERVWRFDLKYGRSFFIKENAKGMTVGAMQVFKASDNLLAQVRSSWQHIAEEIQEGGTYPADNEEAIEMAVDANRMAMFGGAEGKAADEELDALTEIYGPTKVDKELAKLVSLV